MTRDLMDKGNKMNKSLIHELAKQAGAKPIYYECLTGYELPGEDGLEKFAALIVQECTDLVDKIDSIRLETFHRADGSKLITSAVIRQHFGIE
jgi:hypothetical protein